MKFTLGQTRCRKTEEFSKQPKFKPLQFRRQSFCGDLDKRISLIYIWMSLKARSLAFSLTPSLQIVLSPSSFLCPKSNPCNSYELLVNWKLEWAIIKEESLFAVACDEFVYRQLFVESPLWDRGAIIPGGIWRGANEKRNSHHAAIS